MTGLFLHDIEGYDSRDLEDDNDDDSCSDGESLLEFPAPGLYEFIIFIISNLIIISQIIKLHE